MTQPILPPVGATAVYAELLRQVDGYELYFGNEARVRDGDQPTLGNLLIDKLALAVRTLCARVAALELGTEHGRLVRTLEERVAELEADAAADRASIDVLSDEVRELRQELDQLQAELQEQVQATLAERTAGDKHANDALLYAGVARDLRARWAKSRARHVLGEVKP